MFKVYIAIQIALGAEPLASIIRTPFHLTLPLPAILLLIYQIPKHTRTNIYFPNLPTTTNISSANVRTYICGRGNQHISLYKHSSDYVPSFLIEFHLFQTRAALVDYERYFAQKKIERNARDAIKVCYRILLIILLRPFADNF